MQSSAMWGACGGIAGDVGDMGEPLPQSGPGRDLDPPGGECLRAFSSARRRSPDVEQARAVAVGLASRWRRAGRGVAGGAAFRGYRSGVVDRVGPAGTDALVDSRAAVRQAAGRGLRARPVRGRRALAALLADVSDPDRLAEVGDLIIECETAADLLARVTTG